VPTLSTLTQNCTEIPSYNNEAREKNKGDLNLEGKVKLSLFADEMILYLKDPKESYPDLINIFSNIGRYSVSVQKSVAFLYINNEQRNQENISIHDNLKKKIPMNKPN
jgi:hypothetical protein